jgi:hypothetical protein
MAECFFVNESGLLEKSAQTVEECTAFILISPTEYKSFFDSVGLNPEDAIFAFTWGAGTMLTAWALSIPIKYALRTIRLT